MQRAGAASVGYIQPGLSPDSIEIPFTHITANRTQKTIHAVDAEQGNLYTARSAVSTAATRA